MPSFMAFSLTPTIYPFSNFDESMYNFNVIAIHKPIIIPAAQSQFFNVASFDLILSSKTLGEANSPRFRDSKYFLGLLPNFLYFSLFFPYASSSLKPDFNSSYHIKK